MLEVCMSIFKDFCIVCHARLDLGKLTKMAKEEGFYASLDHGRTLATYSGSFATPSSVCLLLRCRSCQR